MSPGDAATEYRARFACSSDVDALPGLISAYQAEVRAQVIRAAENRRRARVGQRLIEARRPPGRWIAAVVHFFAAHRDEPGLEPLAGVGRGELALFMAQVAAGQPGTEALQALGLSPDEEMGLARVCAEELGVDLAARATDRTLRAFVRGARLALSVDGVPPSPTRMTLLGAASEIDPVVGSLGRHRERWEKRLARWG